MIAASTGRSLTWLITGKATPLRTTPSRNTFQKKISKNGGALFSTLWTLKIKPKLSMLFSKVA
jgi:hypothetical protein